jgi:hypothetical protein
VTEEAAVRSRVIVLIAVLVTSVIPARSQTLDDQERCAAQAQKAFQQLENDRKTGPFANVGGIISSDYESHYNTKLKKCLMLVETQASTGNSAMLMDAYERRTYAFYLWISRNDKKYWEVPPTSCELAPTHSEKKYCADRDEFDAFVASYMEE